MPIRRSQQKPQQVLVLTTRPPHMVTAGVTRHLGNCRMTIRNTNLALLDSESLKAVAADIPNHHRVVTDDCLQATMLHLMVSMEHRDRLVVLTDKHPMTRPLPAMNLNTHLANFV